ncbi:hypothetical protein DAI22_06g104650 [Oryza sativa Japonica Group]|nr:hypothetical protein DAI22_06g104650 [Oryza sativa Japonica Group]
MAFRFPRGHASDRDAATSDGCCGFYRSPQSNPTRRPQLAPLCGKASGPRAVALGQPPQPQRIAAWRPSSLSLSLSSSSSPSPPRPTTTPKRSRVEVEASCPRPDRSYAARRGMPFQPLETRGSKDDLI